MRHNDTMKHAEATATDGLPETVTAQCPYCHRKLAPAPLYRHATTMIRRTCRGCRARWAVKLIPTAYDRRGVLVTTAEFVEIVSDRQGRTP